MTHLAISVREMALRLNAKIKMAHRSISYIEIALLDTFLIGKMYCSKILKGKCTPSNDFIVHTFILDLEILQIIIVQHFLICLREH